MPQVKVKRIIFLNFYEFVYLLFLSRTTKVIIYKLFELRRNLLNESRKKKILYLFIEKNRFFFKIILLIIFIFCSPTLKLTKK